MAFVVKSYRLNVVLLNLRRINFVKDSIYLVNCSKVKNNDNLDEIGSGHGAVAEAMDELRLEEPLGIVRSPADGRARDHWQDGSRQSF